MQRIGRASYGTEGLWSFDGRLQGRDDEFRDPGLTGEPRSGHVKNLDAIRPDEGREFLARSFDSGMKEEERLAVFARELGRLLRSTRKQGLDAEYRCPIGIDDVLLSPDQIIGRIGLLQVVAVRDYTVFRSTPLGTPSAMLHAAADRQSNAARSAPVCPPETILRRRPVFKATPRAGPDPHP